MFMSCLVAVSYSLDSLFGLVSLTWEIVVAVQVFVFIHVPNHPKCGRVRNVPRLGAGFFLLLIKVYPV